MPLSDDLRDELAAIAPESDCDRLAELSGLFHVAGSVHLPGKHGNHPACTGGLRHGHRVEQVLRPVALQCRGRPHRSRHDDWL